MKFIVIFLVFSTLVSAKTWLEIVKESDFKNDFPGRHSNELKDNSPALTYLEIQRQILERIVKGSPAVFPADSMEQDWHSDFLLIPVHLHRLILFRAEQQEWQEVFTLLELAEKSRNLVYQNEPAVIDFLVSSSHPRTIFMCLDHLEHLKDRHLRSRTLKKLHRHWLKIFPTRSDFLITRKGEERYAIEIARDFKQYLSKSQTKLDAPVIFFPENFRHQITMKELLTFSVDPTATQKRLLHNLDTTYTWIKSGDSLAEHPMVKQPKKTEELEFYRNHPNGLLELYLAAENLDLIAASANRFSEQYLACEMAWLWLIAEANGLQISNSSDLTTDFSKAQRKFITSRKIQVRTSDRTIQLPENPLVTYDNDTTIEVPNLFRN